MKMIPVWLKITFTAWILVWAPAYTYYHGPLNFLWLCDLSNIIILVALWTESSILFSSQIVVVLIVNILWTIDVTGQFLWNIHLVEGTEYMFNPAIPLHIRLMSLFHVFTIPLLIYAVFRLGYNRKGLLVQTVLTWIILPLSYFLADPDMNINWVRGPFGKAQSILPPWLYLLFSMFVYPVIIYLPGHVLTMLLCRWRKRITHSNIKSS